VSRVQEGQMLKLGATYPNAHVVRQSTPDICLL